MLCPPMNLLRAISQALLPAPKFNWLDPGPLVDGELELVQPSEKCIDAVLASCGHPLTQAADPEQAQTTRDSIRQFLERAPLGHEPATVRRGRAPSYHFWMRIRPGVHSPVPMAGSIGLRIGNDLEIQQYFGHFGYNVYPPVRGRHYAERACRLLFPLARRHGLNPLWITADPHNTASRRTCERLGGVLVDIVDIPPGHVLYCRGQPQKCRYRIEL
jgi:predicted acetyltransferase